MEEEELRTDGDESRDLPFPSPRPPADFLPPNELLEQQSDVSEFFSKLLLLALDLFGGGG